MFDYQSIYFILTVAFAYGLATGSFVTMASYRLPRDEEIVFKPSYCPRCTTSLKLRDLVPFFSWLFQRGRCRYCHCVIHMRYPLIELSVGLMFVLVVYLHGMTFTSLLLLMLVTELAILIVTDLEHFIILDSIQIALLITGLAYSYWQKDPLLMPPLSILCGLSIGLALHYGYLYLCKKDALGWGDVKFLAVAGAWLPLHDFTTFFFIAGAIGTITGIYWRLRGRGAVFPFGPALAVSLFINVLIPDIIGRLTAFAALYGF